MPFLKKFSIIAVAILIMLILFGYLCLKLLYGGETQDRIADEYNGKKLVEYYDMDTNGFKLKLIENNSSTWIRHPACCMDLKNGRVFNDVIKFSREKNNMLIVNGEEFKIEVQNDKTLFYTSVPDMPIIEKSLNRDLEIYFKEKYKKEVRVQSEFLRKGATQSGIAFPKYYLWVKIYDGPQEIDRGAVRVANTDAYKFSVTDFVTRNEIMKDPNHIYSIFPAPVCEKIKVEYLSVGSAEVETSDFQFRFTENRITSAIADIYGLDKTLKLPEKPKIFILINNKPTLTDNNWYVSVYQDIVVGENIVHSLRLSSYRINDSTGVVEKEAATEGTYMEKVATIKP